MLYPKLFYLFFFAALAALVPYIGLYYESVGLRGSQIGILIGIPPLITLFSAGLFGALSDITGRPKGTLLLCLAGFAGSVLMLFWFDAYRWLLLAVAFYALFFAPIVPLADKTTLELLGEHRIRYGRIRLWGSIGWGISAPLTGMLVERLGLDALFAVCVTLLVVVVAVVLRLPVQPASGKERFWPALRQVVGNWRWALFLLTVFISGAALASNQSFLFLYLRELGARETWMGVSLTLSTISELVVLLFSATLLARVGTRLLLGLAMVLLGIRLLGYGLSDSAGVVIALQLLHGPTFGVIWIAGVSYADRLAPSGMKATAQGLFSGMSIGLGAAFGSIGGGILFEHIGLAAMYLWFGWSVLLAGAVFIVISRLLRRSRSISRAEGTPA